MTAELRVDPQVLLNKSGDMKGIRSRLSSIMQDLKGKFQSLNVSFEGEEASAYQAQFNKIHKDIEEMLNIVDEYTRDLDEVAQNYIKVKGIIIDETNSLQTNVFGS